MRRLLVTAVFCLIAWNSLASSRGLAWQNGSPLPDPPEVTGVLISPNSRLVLVAYWSMADGAKERFCRVLDARTGKPLCDLPGAFADVRASVTFLPGNRILMACPCTESPVRERGPAIWDLATGRQVGLLPCQQELGPEAVAVSADGKRALIGHAYGYLTLWDLTTGKVIRRLRKEQPFDPLRTIVSRVWFVSDRSALAEHGMDFRLLDVVTGCSVVTPGESRLSPLALSPSGRLAASPWLRQVFGGGARVLHEKGHLQVWEVASGGEVIDLRAHRGPVLAAAFTPDGGGLLSAGDRTIKRWDLSTGKLVWSLRVAPRSRHAPAAVGFSSDGRLAVTATRKAVKLWDLTRRKPLRVLARHEGTVEHDGRAPEKLFFNREIRPEKEPGKKADVTPPIDLVKAATSRVGFSPEGYPVLPTLSTEMRGRVCDEIEQSAAVRRAYERLDVATRCNVDWFEGVAELEKERAVWSLVSCLCHPARGVQIRALRSLERLKDTRAVPFLLLYAEYMAVILEGSECATIHGVIHETVAKTLSTLTGMQVILQGQDPEGLKKGIKRWRKWLASHDN
jgi:WD40 repeat protein